MGLAPAADLVLAVGPALEPGLVPVVDLVLAVDLAPAADLVLAVGPALEPDLVPVVDLGRAVVMVRTLRHLPKIREDITGLVDVDRNDNSRRS